MTTETADDAVQSSSSRSVDETSLGPDENILAAVSYLFSPISALLVYFLEDENEFARFHAAQSVVFAFAVFGVYVVLMVMTAMLGAILPDILGILVMLVSVLANFGIFVAVGVTWLYLLVTAFQGKRTSLPVVGSLAEKHLL